MTQNKSLAKIALILVAIIWGITFIMVKDALNDAPPFSFATLRFGMASLLTLLLINNKILLVTKNELIGGIICGSFLYFGYAFQNFGLMHTTASKSAFITITGSCTISIGSMLKLPAVPIFSFSRK